MKIKSIVAGIGLMAASSMAMAQGPSFSYVEGGYQLYTASGASGGLFVDGSYRITDEIYAAAGYSMLDGTDWGQLTLRGGYILPLADNMSAYAEGGIINSRLSHRPLGSWGPTYTHSDTGLLLGGGVRMALTPEMEAHGGVRLTTDFSNDIHLIGGGTYEVIPNLSLIGNAIMSLDRTEFTLQFGVRFGL